MEISKLTIRTKTQKATLIDVKAISFGRPETDAFRGPRDNFIYIFADAGELRFDINEVINLTINIKQEKDKTLSLSSFYEEE